MASPMGFDKEGASPTKSRSTATATLRKVSNPFFCIAKKYQQKEKATTGKFICQAVACFLQGLRNGY